MPPPLVQHPPLIRRNSPELHLYGVITLGSWQNLPATKKSDVSSEGEQKLSRAQRGDRQKNETTQDREDSPQGQGRG
jgi:hypothetical protein